MGARREAPQHHERSKVSISAIDIVKHEENLVGLTISFLFHFKPFSGIGGQKVQVGICQKILSQKPKGGNPGRSRTCADLATSGAAQPVLFRVGSWKSVKSEFVLAPGCQGDQCLGLPD